MHPEIQTLINELLPEWFDLYKNDETGLIWVAVDHAW